MILDSMRKSSEDSIYSLTDQSGCSQNEEIFESATLGESKKRIRRYHRKKSSHSNQMYKMAGHLTFRSDYSQEYKILTIHILRLMDLASEKPVNEVNPFVRAYLLPGKMHKQNSKYQKGKKNPFIDEKVIFPNISMEDMNNYKLKIKVYNHSRLMRSELLGEVDIALSSLDLNVSETFKVDLFVKVEKVRKSLSFLFFFILVLLFPKHIILLTNYSSHKMFVMFILRSVRGRC